MIVDLIGRIVYTPLPRVSLDKALADARLVKRDLPHCTVILLFNGKRVEVPFNITVDELRVLYKRAGVDDEI